MKLRLPILFATVAMMQQASAFDLSAAAGGNESLYAEWPPVSGAVRYDVTCTGASLTDSPVDCQLVRRYPSNIRVDVPGLAPAEYVITVKAIDAAGTVVDIARSSTLSVRPYTREGFAFTDGYMPGAYKADGTLKDDAVVLYVTADNVNTITFDVMKDKKGTTETRTGLANILEGMSKGYQTMPMAIRFLGTVPANLFDGLKDGNYINFQGNNTSDRMFQNVTLEGIGCDAALKGYGVAMKRTRAIEIRNVAIMLYGDDGVGMDTDNYHAWIHHCDFFYGSPGSDADQVKGDGSIDMKTRSTDATIDHCHFFDSGKVMGLGGTTGESENLRITFHHNWFDHADSRCPRLHYVTGHIYNNYYDGVCTYCIGNTTESSAFIESNFFRNVKRPIMISGQGTDTLTEKGTFSGQDGGMNKAYDNIIVESPSLKLVYHTDNSVHFDAYLASERDEAVPSTIVSVKGAWAYNNFDTADGMYAWQPDVTAEVPAIVMASAGRVQGGDLKWKFNNPVDDDAKEINTALKAAVTAYQSQMLEVQGANGFDSLAGVELMPCGTDSPVEIFNLQGVRMASDANLPAGVYIVRQGAKITRVVR